MCAAWPKEIRNKGKAEKKKGERRKVESKHTLGGVQWTGGGWATATATAVNVNVKTFYARALSQSQNAMNDEWEASQRRGAQPEEEEVEEVAGEEERAAPPTPAQFFILHATHRHS